MAGNSPEAEMGAGLTDVRDPLPAAVRDPSFPHAVRGYDRHAVDAYVERVNRLIAEMQVSGSPRAALIQQVREVAARLREVVGEPDPAELSAAGAPEANRSNPVGHGP